MLGLGLWAPVSWAKNLSVEQIQVVKTSGLAQQLRWSRFLQYQKTTFGSLESQADDFEFFIATDGNKNLENELLATVKAFFLDEPPPGHKVHAQCQFPARLKYLRSKLPLDQWGLLLQPCTEFAKFKKELDPESISIVFASFDMTNPSSVFGHTFFRVHKRRPESAVQSQELLDQAINFAATVPDGTNPAAYIFKGISGFYPGEYMSVPFYTKIQEYSFHDSRDLWTYRLNLSPEQIDYFVAHLWELGSTYFDYYFFTENCSYHILSALEAAMPEIQVKVHVPFYTIPVATLRALHENPGLVSSLEYRPSVGTNFNYRLSTLTESEKKIFFQSAESQKSPRFAHDQETAEKVHVYDALLDYDTYKNAKLSEAEIAPELLEFRRNILLERASLGVASEPLEVPTPDHLAPHLAHKESRFSFGVGHDQKQAFANFELRFAHHDLLDPVKGLPDNFHTEFFRLNFRQNFEDRKFRLEEWRLFQVLSLPDRTRLFAQKALSMGGGALRVFDGRCAGECLAGTFDVGMGASFRLLQSPALRFYTIVEGKFDFSSAFVLHKGTLGLGPKIGLLWRFTDALAFLSQARIHYVLGAPDHLNVSSVTSLRWSPSLSWAVDVSAVTEPLTHNVQFAMRRFF